MPLTSAPQDQQWGRRPSTMTKILRPRHSSISGMAIKFSLVMVTFNTKSPVAIPVLLDTADTSSTCLNLEKKAPNLSSVMSIGTPSNESLVLRVPIYSACSRTDFVVSTLPASFLASSSLSTSISHSALAFLERILGRIWRPFKASSMASLPTPMSRLLTTSSRASGIVKN